MNTEQEENLLDALTELNLIREENAQRRAEVERLNAQLEQAKKVQAGTVKVMRHAFFMEIDERERAANNIANAELQIDDLTKERDQLRAELERLKGGNAN